tara:strand:- start:29130 stop:29786 length:657 start_codon:yes stop_codon:yes gene_type:complete
MKLKIQQTADNSPTLYLSELDETYHSIHGARQESEHVYIQSGLKNFVEKETIRVFEMGFGTGLNVLLTWAFAKENKIIVSVTSTELYPLNESVWSKLTYAKNDEEAAIFRLMHQSNWGELVALDSTISLKKMHCSFLETAIEPSFEVIYFDAFGPDKQPELWTPNVFAKLYDMLTIGGTLVTYAAKGQVRRDMQSVGFRMERILGPPGKREMLRGWKD